MNRKNTDKILKEEEKIKRVEASGMKAVSHILDILMEKMERGLKNL